MAKNKAPRKAYRPKIINCPITGGLVNQFSECLSTGQIGLLLNANTDHFDAVARVLNVVAKATVISPLKKEYQADCRVMAGGMSAMQQLADRAQRIGIWQPQRHEVEPIALACEVALKLLKMLDVRSLYAAMKALSK